MKKNHLLMLAALLATSWSAYASLPEVVLGPGLNSGRTAYHQRWNRVLSADTAYILTGLYYVDSTFAVTIQPGTLVFGDTASTCIV